MAVGDGANDINMIQKANVGIGIFGKEGHQAASFSDYALPNFKGLRRLLFWHGNSFACKFSNFSRYFIYKNILFCMIVVYFNTETGYSAQTIYSDLYYSLYHITMTILAVAFFTIDKDVDFRKTGMQEKMIGFKLSEFYKHCRDNIISKAFLLYSPWLVYGFISSLAIYYIP